MCYVSIHVFMTEMPILNYNTWNIILRFIKQWFSADLLSIVNAVNQGGKRKRVSVESTLNQYESPPPLILWHLSCMHHCLRFFSFFIVLFICTFHNWLFKPACRMAGVRDTYWTLKTCQFIVGGNNFLKNFLIGSIGEQIFLYIYNFLLIILLVTDNPQVVCYVRKVMCCWRLTLLFLLWVINFSDRFTFNLPTNSFSFAAITIFC